jgi:hypothetical protein
MSYTRLRPHVVDRIDDAGHHIEISRIPSPAGDSWQGFAECLGCDWRRGSATLGHVRLLAQGHQQTPAARGGGPPPAPTPLLHP